MRKLNLSIIIPSIISFTFMLGFIISIFFPFCIAEILSEEVWLSYSGKWITFDSFGNVLLQGKYTSIDGFSVASFPLLITAGIMLMAGFPALFQTNRIIRISRESQVVLLVIFRFIFVLSGILGFTAVMLLLNFKNSSSWDTSQFTFGYYFITITFGITTLIGLPRLFMKITFQDEEEEYKTSLRGLAKLIVFDKKMENYDENLQQEINEQLTHFDVDSLFREILKVLDDSSLERNKLEYIAQPFIHLLDVKTLEKYQSIVRNIGNPVKRFSAEKLVELIAAGLLEERKLVEKSIADKKKTKEKLRDETDVSEPKDSLPSKIAMEDKKQKISKITKKDIDVVRKLIGNKESIEIQLIEDETGMSKTKIKLIALELNMEIQYGTLKSTKK